MRPPLRERPAQPKVADLAHTAVGVACAGFEQDVVVLQIPVADAARVEVLHAGRNVARTQQQGGLHLTFQSRRRQGTDKLTAT